MAFDGEEESDAAELIKSKLGDPDASTEASTGAETGSAQPDVEEGPVVEDGDGRAAPSREQEEAPSTQRFQQLKQEEKEERLQEMDEEEREENEADVYDPEEEGNILH